VIIISNLLQSEIAIEASVKIVETPVLKVAKTDKLYFSICNISVIKT